MLRAVMAMEAMVMLTVIDCDARVRHLCSQGESREIKRG